MIFTVRGNPVPYCRTTQAGARFDKGYKRYQVYKDCVVASFLAQCKGDWGSPKPLTTTKENKTEVKIMIYFQNGKHGDPDNVFKGIADALFTCDKYVYGSFMFDYDQKNPRVEVEIN